MPIMICFPIAFSLHMVRLLYVVKWLYELIPCLLFWYISTLFCFLPFDSYFCAHFPLFVYSRSSPIEAHADVLPGGKRICNVSGHLLNISIHMHFRFLLI